jgi:hypothetical protein
MVLTLVYPFSELKVEDFDWRRLQKRQAQAGSGAEQEFRCR